MPESFNVDIQCRAYNSMLKLRADQIEHLETKLNGGSKGLEIEEAYHSLTGMLLEPVIARYWLDCKKIPLKNPQPLQLNSFSSHY